MSILDILKQPITTDTDILEHFVKYLPMLQDWESIRVFDVKESKDAKEVILDYCYARVKDGDEKGTWEKCKRKSRDCKKQCGIDIFIDQKERSILKDNVLKDKLLNNQEKHIVCSEINLGNMHKALLEHIFTERYIPELDAYDKSKCKNKIVIYEYPPYTIIPDNEPTEHPLGLYYERQQIDLLRQLAIKRKVILETTRHGSIAAMTAIIARNLSHNIGSHVLSRWIAALNELLEKNEKFKDITRATWNDLNPGTRLNEVSECYKNLGNSKPLFQYIQHRMDFIATVATSVPSSEMTMDFKKDVLSPFTDKEWNKVILENIAASEGFNNISFEENDGDLPENCRRVSIPNGIIGTHAIYSILENFIRNAAKHYKGTAAKGVLPIGIELKIPDRVKLEGTAGNGKKSLNNKVEFQNNVLTIKKDAKGQTYMLTKGEQEQIKEWFSDEKNKQVLERFFYIHARYIKLRIWDMRKGSCNAKILEDLREFLDRNGKKGRLIEKDGTINPDGWGIKEMVVSSNFLRKNSPKKLIGDLDEKEPSIMEVMCDDESNDIFCKNDGKNCHRNDNNYKDILGIRLYLRRPKDLWIIGDNEVIIKKDKFEIEYSNIVKENEDKRLAEDIPHRLLFVDESKKNHYEDDPMAPMRIMTYKGNVNNEKAVDDEFYLERYEEFIKKLGGYKEGMKLPLVYYGGGKEKKLFENVDDCLKGKYLSNKAPFQPCGYAKNDNKSLPFFYYHANEGDGDTVTKLINGEKYFQPISGKYTSVRNKLETLPNDKQYQRHFLLELIESFLTKVLIIDERVSDLADKVAFHDLKVRDILGNMKIDCLKLDKENITYGSLEGKLKEIGAVNNCIADRRLSDYRYHFLVIHQGILDKVKKNGGNPNGLIQEIDCRWLVIDSGRGVPKELKECGDARFVETSALLKMLEEYDKHGLVQTLFSLRRPLVNDKSKD